MEYHVVGFNIPPTATTLKGGDVLYAILDATGFNLFGIVVGYWACP